MPATVNTRFVDSTVDAAADTEELLNAVTEVADRTERDALTRMTSHGIWRIANEIKESLIEDLRELNQKAEQYSYPAAVVEDQRADIVREHRRKFQRFRDRVADKFGTGETPVHRLDDQGRERLGLIVDQLQTYSDEDLRDALLQEAADGHRAVVQQLKREVERRIANDPDIKPGFELTPAHPLGAARYAVNVAEKTAAQVAHDLAMERLGHIGTQFRRIFDRAETTGTWDGEPARANARMAVALADEPTFFALDPVGKDETLARERAAAADATPTPDDEGGEEEDDGARSWLQELEAANAAAAGDAGDDFDLDDLPDAADPVSGDVYITPDDADDTPRYRAARRLADELGGSVVVNEDGAPPAAAGADG